MNTVLVVLALLGAERTYTVDAPLWDIVGELRVADMDPKQGFIGDVLPRIQESLPRVIVKLYAVPTGTSRYYRVELLLDQAVTVREGGRLVKLTGCRYVAELWPDGNKTIVRSSIDLDVELPRTRCGLVNRVIDRVGGRLVAEAEQGILYRAKAKMQELAAQSKN